MARSKRPHLTSVDGDGQADEAVETPAEEPKTVHETLVAALEGSSRDVFATLRLQLAQKLDRGEVSSNAIRSAYQELRELDRLIRAEDAAEKQEREKREREGAPGRRSFDASAI